jgi:hypothetical protein
MYIAELHSHQEEGITLGKSYQKVRTEPAGADSYGISISLAIAYLLAMKIGNAYVNDVYVNGQNQDMWCRANKMVNPLVISNRFDDNRIANSPTCYKFRFSMNTLQQEYNSVCLIEHVERDGAFIHCICSSD